MSKQSQYNVLAGLSLVIFAILVLAGKPDAMAMAALTTAGTLAGRGKV